MTRAQLLQERSYATTVDMYFLCIYDKILWVESFDCSLESLSSNISVSPFVSDHHYLCFPFARYLDTGRTDAAYMAYYVDYYWVSTISRFEIHGCFSHRIKLLLFSQNYFTELLSQYDRLIRYFCFLLCILPTPSYKIVTIYSPLDCLNFRQKMLAAIPPPILSTRSVARITWTLFFTFA